MYVIQSNINHQDFQSMMYKVTDLTWEEYKEYMLSNNYGKEIIGTMQCKLKLKDCTYETLDINDDYHLRLKITRPDGFSYVSECYLVTDDNFQNLINN
jgi:hypothetical protein